MITKTRLADMRALVADGGRMTDPAVVAEWDEWASRFAVRVEQDLTIVGEKVMIGRGGVTYVFTRTESGVDWERIPGERGLL